MKKNRIIIVEKKLNGQEKILDVTYNFKCHKEMSTIITFKDPKSAYNFLKEENILIDIGSKIIFREVL